MVARAPRGAALVGRLVRVDPLTADDVDGLHALMSDPAAFGSGYPYEVAHADRDRTAAFVADRISGDGVAYAVRVVSPALGEPGEIAGTTSLTEVDPRNEKLHLGWTFYGRRFWASGVNVETKLLVLGHAFDDLGFGRVRIQTDVRNERSRGAITRLGARFEGIARRDVLREDGTWRDTVIYSITVEDWPVVRAALEERLRPAVS